MKTVRVAKELLKLARELTSAGKVVLKAGVLSVTKDDIYGIFCDVTGDPKMSKRTFVRKYRDKVVPFMNDFDRERHVIGTINFKSAMRSLDRAFRNWVEDAIKHGAKISEKALEGIDEDDGGDDYGKMWDIEDKAKEAGYVLKGGYYEVQ